LELVLEEVVGGAQPTWGVGVVLPTHEVEEEVAPHVVVRSYHPPR
jgi:hypothetical protein